MSEGTKTGEEGLAAVIAAAQQAVHPREIDPAKLYHVGVAGEQIDFEWVLDNPRRPMGQYRVATVESFMDLVDRFNGDVTTIWIDPDAQRVVAVFNDNGPDVAGWADFRVHLPLVETSEWKHWSGSDGRMMDQEGFAEHIEDGVKELVQPDAATMLEIAQSIHATVNTEFRSARRVADGEVQMVYVEEIEGTAGQKGELTIPQTFDLAIAPFLGEETYAVKARLRYRIGGGSLRIGYHLERPQDVILDALERIKARLDEKYSEVFMGAPSDPR